MFEKLFSTDQIPKRERVELTLNHQGVDRVALHDQLSYNPGVIAMYTGKRIDGFSYTVDDVCTVIRQTLDICFPPLAPRGTGRVTTDDGFVIQNDNWTTWHVSRPFHDADGARKWLRKCLAGRRASRRDPRKLRGDYRRNMHELQAKIGETVIFDYSMTEFCSVFNAMGLELFCYFCEDHLDEFVEFIEACVTAELERIHAVADRALSPVILIPEDFATKQGPIFPPAFLAQTHYPYVKRLTDAWHEHGLKVIYHSDGNYRKAVPDLIACGVDGFYCLEPACGMDIVDLKQTWPNMVWAGGLDGVDLMERGSPAAVRAEVHRHIRETDALRTGGVFMASSSEINPPIKPENFRAMIQATGELTNPDFHASVEIR